jgi:hypothetical protein
VDRWAAIRRAAIRFGSLRFQSFAAQDACCSLLQQWTAAGKDRRRPIWLQAEIDLQLSTQATNPGISRSFRVPLTAARKNQGSTDMTAKTTSSKAKAAPAAATRQTIEEQIESFLASGGEIQQIARGVSGQVWTSSRQITIGKK